MQNSVLEIEPDIFTEMERIQLERMKNKVSLNDEDECVFCGSIDKITFKELSSQRFERPMDLPICIKCRDIMGERRVEEFLIDVENRDSSHWSRIILFNIRKTDWVSRVVFDQLKRRSDRELEEAIEIHK